MVKIDIVRKVQLAADISYQDAELMVNELLELIKDTLEDGEKVLISGFGKFSLRNKPGRPGRDPKTKIEYPIEPRRVVTFTPSKVWREEFRQTESE